MLPFNYSGPSLSLYSVHFVDSVQLESNPALSALFPPATWFRLRVTACGFQARDSKTQIPPSVERIAAPVSSPSINAGR